MMFFIHRVARASRHCRMGESAATGVYIPVYKVDLSLFLEAIPKRTGRPVYAVGFSVCRILGVQKLRRTRAIISPQWARSHLHLFKVFICR